uniref:Thyroid peroxidase n=1 Tax=Stegastes partitus TaxID=144197 RepID=A0A3B4Z479_9TELE
MAANWQDCCLSTKATAAFKFRIKMDRIKTVQEILTYFLKHVHGIITSFEDVLDILESCRQNVLHHYLTETLSFFVMSSFSRSLFFFFNSQIITMRDYLPKIIGSESFQEFIGPYRGYDPTVNPSAANVFATAAFRFGHGTVSPILPRLNESFQEHERFCHLRMHATFFSPWRIVNEGGIEPILRGMIGSAASVASSKMLVAEEVTERLILMNSVERMDLASMNMQRGRDHGLPGYNDWRKFCGLRRVRTLKDLAEVVGDYRVAEKVLNIYKHVDNIDVWLGGLLESLLPGARTGPLFACLIGKQMKMIRDGDRFWWSAEGIFTQQQKNELLQFSLSRLICDNSDVGEVLPDSFQRGTYPCDYVSCDHIPSMNLEAWREKRLGGLERLLG